MSKTKEQYRHEVEEILRRDREKCLASCDGFQLPRGEVDRVTKKLEAEEAEYLRDWSEAYDKLEDASACRHALALVLVRLSRVENDVSSLENDVSFLKNALWDFCNEVDGLQCGPETERPSDV